MASQQDIQNLAYTMLGEAKPGDTEGMTAVGNTVLNRLAAGSYGSTITAVVKAPNQYAAWGIGSQAAGQAGNMATKYPVGSPQYQAAYDLATQLVNGDVQDNTGGAVNYRAASLGTSWAGGKPTINIGGNIYQVNHPISAGTQLIATDPNASSLDAYNSAYGWNSLPDADPQTGAPVVTAQASTPSPGDALGAINSELGPGALTSPQGAPDASAYAPQPASQPVPLAPQQGDQTAPIPMNPSDVAPSQDQVNQTALNSVKQWLQGSNVDLSKVPASQQAALVAAIPTIASLANDPKSELNYLQSSGLYSALVAAVPSHAPNFAESAWASMNGVKLPALLPDDIGSWGLPTGADANAAVSTIDNFLTSAQNQRVPVYAPDTGSDLGTVQQQSPASWAQPYTSNPTAVAAGQASTGSTAASSNALSNWAQPYYDNVSNSGSSNSSSSGSSGGITNWADPYYSAIDASDPTAVNNGFNINAGAGPGTIENDYGSDQSAAVYQAPPSVSVPQYITISKQIQVPADQPIEQGSGGVVWDPAQQNFVLSNAPAPAAKPAMVTKVVQQRVPNPAYTAPTPAPAAPVAPQPIAVSNGYNYLQNASGGYTNVGQTNPNLTPSQAYAQAAAPALASQTNLGGGGGNHDSQNRSGGGLTG